MTRSIGTRTARVTLVLLVIALLALGCGAAKQAPKYGDDVIRGIGKVFGKSADDAERYLDDAGRLGRFAPEAEVAVATWSTRVGAIADDLATSHFKLPDEQAAARALVVGTACDAFEKLEERRRAIGLAFMTQTEIQAIVDENRVTSRLPDGVSTAFFVVELVSEIDKALKASDLTTAFPAIARLTACELV